MMSPEVERMLENAPSPWRWSIVILLLGFGLAMTSSALIAIVAGLAMGYYHGNYQGRRAVIKAWRRDLEIQTERIQVITAKVKAPH